MAKRKAIPTVTKLRLFSASAGHCQRPECLTSLFLSGGKHIAEMAHVLPHSKMGPRSGEICDEESNPDLFENLILLCPSCHTIIDKNPESYPRVILLAWKRNHWASLSSKQGAKTYSTRSEVRAAVVERLAENKAIWKMFAPIHGSEFKYDPESDVAELWVERMKSVILPNHYQIQSVIDKNLNHMTDTDRIAYADFKEHVRGLAGRHVCGLTAQVTRFPQDMEGIFACNGK
jgi:hypothetical protein